MSGPVWATADCFIDGVQCLPPLALTLRNPLVHMNARQIGAPDYARALHLRSAARDVLQPPVILGRFSPGTRLAGAHPFRLLTQGRLIAEQEPPQDDDPWVTGNQLAQLGSDAIEIDRPCLLVCHPGGWCWGHWLLDMLPKIVLAEQAAPKHFMFAVPAALVDVLERPEHAPTYVASVLGSLAAYGIGASRLLRISTAQSYRFADLSDMAGIGGKEMHPGVLAAMRALPTGDAPAGPQLTAVLRSAPSCRVLSRVDEMRARLRDAGAVFLDPLRASFADQVQAFRNSELIVGDLGSNLAAIIYAAPGTGLVTLGPLYWTDDYFASLLQRLDLLVADVRGPSKPVEGEHLMNAAYDVEPTCMETGLRALTDARHRLPPEGVCVDGRRVARHPGKILLRIDFGVAGSKAEWQGEGFEESEDDGAWSAGAGCQIVVPAPAGQAGGVWIEVAGQCFANPPVLPSRMLGISANGTRLADFDVDGETLLHVLVPASLLQAAPELTIVFHHPERLSPRMVGLADDDRDLAFFFHTLSLRAAYAA